MLVMYFVYVIQSQKDGRLYKGITIDKDRRLKDHNYGKNKFTKAWRPWNLIYFEKVHTRTDAREREKFLKSGEGREYLKQFIPR